MSAKGTWARLVLAGAVMAGGAWGGTALPAEGPKDRPAASAPAAKSGKVVGILLAKTETEITVKPEGSKEPQRFLVPAANGKPDPKIQATVKGVFIPNLVALKWRLADEDKVLTDLAELVPVQKQGVVSGTVVAKGSGDKEAYIDVKPDGQGFTERYWPRWMKDGFDKDLMSVISTLNVGDKVKVGWYRDERKRAAQLKVTARAKVPASQPDSK